MWEVHQASVWSPPQDEGPQFAEVAGRIMAVDVLHDQSRLPGLDVPEVIV